MDKSLLKFPDKINTENVVKLRSNILFVLTLRVEGGWVGGGGGILPSDIRIPDLLTNYPMEFTKLKTARVLLLNICLISVV